MYILDQVKKGLVTFVVAGSLISGFALAATVSFGEEDCSDAQATAGLCSKDMSAAAPSNTSNSVPASGTATSNSSPSSVPQATPSTPQASVPAASSASTSGSTAATSSAQAQPASTTLTTAAPPLFTLEEAKTWCVTGNTKSACEGRLELLNGGLRVTLKTGTPVDVELKGTGICANVYNAEDKTVNAVASTQKLSVKMMTAERCSAAIGSGSTTTGSATATATASATTATTAPPVYIVPANPGGQGVLSDSSTICDPVAAFGGGTWTKKTGGFLYVGAKGEFTAKTVPTGWMLQGDGVTYRPGDVIDTVVFTARCL